jgi:hypothetical protein
MNHPSRPHFFGMLAGLFLAVGLVLSAMLASTAWVKIKNSQFVTVKGSARKNIQSDLAIWRGSFTTEADTLLDAQQRLKVDRVKVEGFLQAQAVKAFTLTPIAIAEIKASLKDTNGFVQIRTSGYRLTQTVIVESAEVNHVIRLDGESTALVEQGVLFTTQPPEFIYTRAGEAKVEMLGEATRDARVRAEQIASQGGRRVARLHSADMGVFQIAPLHSVQTSWEGMNDTSSLEKTITAVVTATFSLE